MRQRIVFTASGFVFLIIGTLLITAGVALSTVVTGGGAFTTWNPTGSSSSPSTWFQGQGQLLSTQFAINTVYALATTQSNPVMIGFTCTSGCGTAPTNPYATASCGSGNCAGALSITGQAVQPAVLAQPGAWINYTWASATANGITGTSAYPVGANIQVNFIVLLTGPSLPSGCTQMATTYTGGQTVYMCWVSAFATVKSGVSTGFFDFSISSTIPLPSPIPTGTPGTATVTVAQVGSVAYPGPTSLAIGCSSSSVSPCQIAASSIAGSGGSTTVTVGSGTPGSYSFTVVGTYPGLSPHTTSSTFLVAGGSGSTTPDFTMTTTTTSLTAPVGGSASASIVIASLNSFTGTVALTASARSNTIGGTCTIAPTSGTLGSSFTATLSLTATSPGTFTCDLNGASGTLTHVLSIIGSLGQSGTGGGWIPLPYFVIGAGLVLIVAGVWPRKYGHGLAE